MMRWMFRIAATCLVLAACASIFYFAYDRGMVRFNYPSLQDYPVQGVDVSHHQGDIDWRAVAAQPGMRFAIIKATEGGDYRDPKFSQNWQAAKAADLVRGAYHFFTFCRPGVDQARNVIATVPREVTTLPITVDIEFVGNCDKVPTLDELSQEVTAFVNELRTVFPEKPIFYMNTEFRDQYFSGNENRFPDHSLWLRSVFKEPEKEGCAYWSIWQFADNATIKGINGPVDLNAVCPGEASFSSLFPELAGK
jgi:lysozyme